MISALSHASTMRVFVSKFIPTHVIGLPASQYFSNIIDIIAILVNGRDWVRDRQGIIGNFDATEALEITVALNADVLLPLHNDLFAGNRVSPAILAEYQDRRFPIRNKRFFSVGFINYMTLYAFICLSQVIGSRPDTPPPFPPAQR